MTRIEKTQINCSAFITLCSTLRKLQSDNPYDLVINGNQASIVKRQINESKIKEFIIDLNFLDELFKAIMTGSMGPLIIKGDAEQYLRNCSWACHYYRTEKESLDEYDHFELFHKIHFADLKSLSVEADIVKQFCRLFRIEYETCEPFVHENKNVSKVVTLPPKKFFNELFRTITFIGSGSFSQMTLDSERIAMMDSLDSLFAIKDLLAAREIDTSSIPDYNLFAIQQDEEAIFAFNFADRHLISINFRYDQLRIEIKKNYA